MFFGISNFTSCTSPNNKCCTCRIVGIYVKSHRSQTVLKNRKTTILRQLFPNNSSSSFNSCNFFEFLVLHTIRAQLLYQSFKLAHSYPSISAMILLISARNEFSRATISSILALSSAMSMTSLVSSASTYVLTERL